MIVLIVLLISLCVAYGFWGHQQQKKVWQYIEQFPGPRRFPLVGNLFQLGTRPHEHLHIMRGFCHKYKNKMFRFYVAAQPYVVLSDSKDLEVVLSSTQFLHKEDLYDLFRPWLGYGLLTSSGTRWHQKRKIITPSFHFQILQEFLGGMNEATDKLIDLLRRSSKDEAIFDVQPLVARSTLDVICDTAMGVQLNSTSGKENSIVTAVNDMCRVVEGRAFSMFKRFQIFFQFTPLFKVQQRALKVLRTELSQVIEKRREVVNETFKHRQFAGFKKPKLAFLDNLITAEIDGRPLTFEEIYEEVSTFIFEGHDTAASAISFTLYCLSRHPEVQERAFKEQQNIFGSDRLQHPTYQDLQDMKYLELVIKETLRLYPSVPVIARTTTELVEINGKLLPPSTTILLFIMAASFNLGHFEDPLAFRPERFETDFREKSNPFEYIPFSAGPRNCIGQKFAIMELKCTLSKLLRHFEVLPPVDGMPMYLQNPAVPNDLPRNKYDPVLVSYITLKAENGVFIRLRERKY